MLAALGEYTRHTRLDSGVVQAILRQTPELVVRRDTARARTPAAAAICRARSCSCHAVNAERGSTSADSAPKARRQARLRRPAQRKGGRIAPSFLGYNRNGACRRAGRHGVSRALVPFHCGYMAVIRKRDEQRAVLRDFVTVWRISSCKMTKSPARPCRVLRSGLQPTPAGRPG